MNTNISILNDCLIVSVPNELSLVIFKEIQEDILHSLKQNEIHNVLLDMNAVKIFDEFEFRDFIQLSKTISLLGAETVFTGFNPGVISSLVEFDINFEEIKSFGNLKSGLDYLTKSDYEDSIEPDILISEEIDDEKDEE